MEGVQDKKNRIVIRPGPEILVARGETQFEALNTNIHIKHFLILSVDAYFLDKIVVNL